MQNDYIKNRAAKEINKTEYYAVNPKFGVKQIDLKGYKKRLKDKYYKQLLAVTLGTAVLASSLTAGLTIHFSEEISRHQNESKLQTIIASEYKNDPDVKKLVDEQSICFTAYPDKIVESLFAPPLYDKCDNSECSVCNKNRNIEEKLTSYLSEKEEYKDIVDLHEFYQSHGGR